MDEYFSILLACPLFEGIHAEDLGAMLGCLNAQRIERGKGEAVFLEGDPANRMGIVLSGALQIVKNDFYGNRSIVDTVGPSQLFGESFACAGLQPMPVSCVATQPSVLLLLDCGRVTQTCCNACAFHSRVILNLLRVVADKNLALNQRIEILSRRTIREKLMAYLMDQAKQSRSASFTIPYDRQGLADFLGVERSALSAEIGRLRSEGILKSDRSRFMLCTNAWPR